MIFSIGIINIHTVQMLFYLFQSVFAYSGPPMIYNIIILKVKL